jgi:membrane protein DedA with SNARE-associated domain
MIGWIEQFIRDMGYTGLALLVFLENIFPPIPSEVIIPLGGFLSTQQQSMHFIGVIVAGVIGTVLGSLLLYYLGRWLHAHRLRDWAEKHGHWVLLDPEDIDKAMNWFDHHGKAAVFFARLVPGVRSLISIPAGSCGMNIWQYLLYTLAGTAIWITALAYAGRILGQNYSNVSNVIQWATYAVLAVFVGSIIWWIAKKRGKGQQAEET